MSAVRLLSVGWPETMPEEKPVSPSAIVRMRTRPIRPAPEWRLGSGGGEAEPEKRNWPGAWRASISWRAKFHKEGANCHSSI
jgi:hypothetical protein